MIAPEDLALFTFVDDPVTALTLLKSRLASAPTNIAPDFACSRTPPQTRAKSR
jgi:hypothetical protein